MQPLVQSFEGQSPAALCLGTCLTSLSAAAIWVHDAGQTTLYSCASLLVPCVDVLSRERCAYVQGYQGVVKLVGDGADGCLQGLGEEVGKGKCVGSVSFDHGAIAGLGRG